MRSKLKFNMTLIGCAMLGTLLFFQPSSLCAAPLSGDAYKLADQAYQALAADDAAGAEQYARKAIALQNDNSQLGLLLLNALIQQDKLKQAHQQADKLLLRWPDDGQILAQRGFLFQKDQQCKKAISDFRSATEFGLESPEQDRNIRLSWADCATSINRPDTALDALSPLRNSNDFEVQIRLANLLVSQGNYAAANAAANLASSSAHTSAQQNSAAQLANKIASRVRVYKKSNQDITENLLFNDLPAVAPVPQLPAAVTKNAPLSGDAFVYADQAYKDLASGNTSAAESNARKSLNLRPDNQQIGILLTNTLIQQGKLDAARQQSDTLISQWPNNAQVLAQRGFLLQRQNLFDAAIASFSQAVKAGLSSASQEKQIRMAWSDSALSLHDSDSGLTALAPLKNKSDYAIQSRLANLYIDKNDYRSALNPATLAAKLAETTLQRSTSAKRSMQLAALLNKKLTSNTLDTVRPAAIITLKTPAPVVSAPTPKANDPLTGDAYTYADQAYKAIANGDPIAAEQYTRKAMSVRPNNKSLEFLLVDILMQQNKLDSARLQSDSLISQWSSDAQVLAQRGFLLQRQKLYDAAIASFSRATKAGLASTAQEKQVRLAWADSAQNLHNPDSGLAALAPYRANADYDVQTRLANLYADKKDYANARIAADKAVKAAGTVEQRTTASALANQFSSRSQRPATPRSPFDQSLLIKENGQTIVTGNTPFAAPVAAISSTSIESVNAPLSGDAYTYADQAYKALANGDALQAEQLTRKALVLRSDSKQLGLLLMNTLMQQGKLGSARRQSDQMLTRWPHDAQLLAQRGFLFQKQQLFDAAINSFSAATKAGLASSDQEKQIRLAWADSALGLYQPDAALSALAPLQNSNDFDVQLRLARVHMNKKNYIAAQQAAERARQTARTQVQQSAAGNVNAQINRLLQGNRPAPSPLQNLNRATIQPVAFNSNLSTAPATRNFQPISTPASNAPLTGDAYAYADQAYKALANSDGASAEAYARKALALRPDSSALGLLLLNALNQQGKHELARQQSDLLLQRFPGNAQVLAQRGFLFQRQQQCDQAINSFSQATRAGLQSTTQEKFVRLAWADCAQQIKQPDSGLAALAPLQNSSDYEVQIRLANLRTTKGDKAGAKQAAQLAERTASTASQRANALAIINQASAFTTESTIPYETVLTPYQGRQNRAQPVYYAQPGNQMQNLSYNGPTSQAVQINRASQTYGRAASQAPSTFLKLAYGYVAKKNDVKALEAFQQAFALGQGDARNYADAAFAAIRIGDNDAAKLMFSKALDLNAAMPESNRYFNDESVYNYRRSIESITRSSGIVANIYYQGNGAQAQNNQNVIEGGLEAYIQPDGSSFLSPGGLGYNNGRILQFFVRGTATLYDRVNKITGAKTLQGSVGARYKPLGDWNLVLTAERLFKIGKFSFNDWLLRVGYSTGIGSDLRPELNAWRNWQLFGEVARYVKLKWTLANGELTYGKNFKYKRLLDPYRDHVTLYPHLVLATTYDSKALKTTTFAIGPGFNIRYWFREDQYRAPASYLELGLQYRFEITNTGRGGGPVMRATLWY